MCSILPRRWFSLFVALLIVLIDLMPFSATAHPTQFAVAVQADCLSCTLAKQFPVLYPQLQGEVEWATRKQLIGKQTVVGLEATVASTNIHPPMGLKLQEQQAWMAMAMRKQMHLFLPPTYNGTTVVEQGKVRVEVQPVRALSAKAERQGKVLVYKNAYPNTDSLQVVKQDQSEEFLYLRDSTSPTVFDYKLKVSQGVQIRSVAGSVEFVDSRGQGVRIERPWLVDSTGKRSETAVNWQILEGGKRLRLVVMPLGLGYPLVLDPSWTTTSSMGAERYLHTATLLQNGKVLVTAGGGTRSASGLSNSAELYNPATGTWANASSMSTPRFEHTATLLPNGKVLVTGGSSGKFTHGTTTLNSAELYNPQTGTWSITGSMNTARRNHTATLLTNGKVLVAGGAFDGISIHTALSDAELYDPKSNTWNKTGSMKGARYWHTATLLPNGNVLVAGGIDSSHLNSAELYSPQTGTWTTTGSMSIDRRSHTATLLSNGKVLVVGSSGNGGGSTELYNPQTGTWSATGFMNIEPGRGAHTATLLANGKVLIAGGSWLSRLSSAELYDPQSGTWSITDQLSVARYWHTATLLPDGKVLVIGGRSDNININFGLNVLNGAEVYAP
jgi:N-acetylneuraminic acid mutarotase